MKDVIFLVVDRRKVVRMTKSVPQTGRGELPVKIEVVVNDGAFREPVLTRQVEIRDWRDGIEVDDVLFDGHFITEEEAEIIKQRRLATMAHVLKDNGWEVTRPEEPGDEPKVT